MKLSDITIDNLKGNQRELAEIIGMEAYIKLVKQYGGDDIYIAKETNLLSMVRDDEIYRKFNGGNYKALADEYNLAVRTIYEIISKENEKRSYQQLSIFDDAKNS